jgi:putative ABC transport system permease protein
VAVGLGAAAVWALRGALGLAPSTTATLVVVAFLVGSSLVVPSLVPGFARVAGRGLVRLAGELGGYASGNLARHRDHVGVTAATFLVSLAGAIVVASWLSSLERTLGSWLDALFSRIDLVLASGVDPLNSPQPLPGSLADEVAALPGVARVDAIRVVEVAYDGLVTKVVAGEMRLFAEGLRRLEVLDGDAAEATAALVRGEGVVVNEPFARRFGRWRGDAVVLATPAGPVRLPIVAVYFDLSFADVGVVQMDRALYRRLWRDDTLDFVEPVLAPGADRAQVIDVRWGERHELAVITSERYRGDMAALLAQSTAVAYPLVVIAVAVALLGVTNALLAALVDRTRELATLRAVGATRAQVARLVMTEAALVGVLGGVAGVVVGSLLGRIETDLLFRGVFGMTVFYRYPAGAVAVALLAGVTLTAATGWGVGRRAAAQPIVRGLAYE